jgi:transcriptional regulator with XRE-family HTH domain
MNTGDRIKELRKSKGMTQQDLAQKLGLQDSAIAKYENGRVENIKRSVIADMAQVLDCSPVYLLGLDDGFVLNDDEKRIIEQFREADEDTKKMVRRLLSYVEQTTI